MTTSRVGPLIDYLVGAFTNAATLGQATPAVDVYDGPVSTAAPSPLELWVGVDDTLTEQPTTSATAEQIRQGLANKKQETVTIHCAAVAWAGVDDMKTVRTAAFAILAAAEDIIRLDTSHFGGNAGAALPGVSGVVLQQNNTQQGAVAQVTFTVTFVAFIGS